MSSASSDGTNTRRAHLIHDLRPYVCTYPNCNAAGQSYDSRRDWIEHENTFHRRIWRCPEHDNSLYASREEYLKHVTAEHKEDTKLMSSETYLRSCESVAPTPDRACPVCFFSPADARTLQSHLAHHLERFSLFALPRSTEDEDPEDDRESDSAAAIDADESSREMDSVTESEPEDEWRTVFLEAARSGSLPAMRQILDNHVSEIGDGLQNHIDAALVEAAAHGHNEVVDMLLDGGANINGVVRGRTALIAAACKGNLKLVTALVNRGAAIDLSGDEETPLMAAVLAGHVDVVLYLLDLEANINAVVESRTALIDASTTTNMSLVQLLLERGADPNIVAHDETALNAATSKASPNIVQGLLDAGANINAEADGLTALATAAMMNLNMIVQLLVDRGADLNHSTRKTLSALSQAAHRGYQDTVQLLLDLGASVNLGQEASALQEAVTQGHENIADILIANGADVNWGNHAYATVLQTASEYGLVSIVEKLISAGADANTHGTGDSTPLRVAALNDHAEIVRMLLEAGADADATNHYNETALHLACKAGNEDVVTALLHARPNLETSSRRSGTALQVAKKHGHKSIISRLLAAGASADPAGYHMDEFVHPGASFKSNSAYPPASPRAWEVDVLSEGAETMSLTQIHDIAHTSAVTCVNFSGDGQSLVIGGRWSAWVYRLDDMGKVSELKHIVSRDSDLHVRAACISKDNKLVLTGGEDHRVCLWDLETGSLIDTFGEHEMDVYAVAFSPVTTIIASADADGMVNLHNYQTGDELVRDYCHDAVTSISFSPDGKYLAVGSLSRIIHIIYTDNKWEMTRLTGDLEHGHLDSVLSVAWSTNGEQLFTASLDKTIKCWRLSVTPPSGIKTHWVRTVTGHEVSRSPFMVFCYISLTCLKGSVLSVAETGHSNWIISGSKDKTFRVWSGDTGEPQLRLKGHRNSVISVAACLTENLIATASGDMTFTVWRYDKE